MRSSPRSANSHCTPDEAGAMIRALASDAAAIASAEHERMRPPEFSLGVKTQDEQGDTAALPYYKRAIEIDPSFILGYWHVGAMYLNLGESERGIEYLTKAFQLREHGSEREKMGISALYYLYATGELDKAAQTLEQEIEIYKDSPPYMNLGIVYMSLGNYEKAEETIRKDKRQVSVVVINLTICVVAQQHFDEARQLIREAMEKGADVYEFHFHLYVLAFLASDSAAMAEQQRWFAGKPDYENIGLDLA